MRTVDEMYDQIKALVKETYAQGFIDGQQDNMAFDDGIDEAIHETLKDVFTDRLREICEAERDDRLIVRPDCAKCAYSKAVKHHEPCFDCIGQDRYGTEKGYYFKPRAEAEAALGKGEAE